MTLPNEITITPNEGNGAPYHGYEGGEGVVYVRGDQWSTDMDAAPKDGAGIMWHGSEGPEMVFWCNYGGQWLNASGKHPFNDTPTHWRHIDLPQTKETK